MVYQTSRYVCLYSADASILRVIVCICSSNDFEAYADQTTVLLGVRSTVSDGIVGVLAVDMSHSSHSAADTLHCGLLIHIWYQSFRCIVIRLLNVYVDLMHYSYHYLITEYSHTAALLVNIW